MEAPHVQGELSLREVQQGSLSILKKIDDVCHKEGIRYWLMYGTLIGAVRHHGFIPWDDDLDIAMPRPDYERFLAHFDNHANELWPLVALHNTENRELPFLITRVSDTSYKMIGEYGDEIPELGTFVDVYPIDGCGNNSDEATNLKNKCFDAVLNYLRASNFKSNSRNANAAKRVLKGIYSMMLGNSSGYCDEVYRLATSNFYDCSSYCACLVWPCEGDPLIERENIDELMPIQFEDMNSWAPIGYDKVLRDQYGDYMQLPPENERVGHHYYSIVKR